MDIHNTQSDCDHSSSSSNVIISDGTMSSSDTIEEEPPSYHFDDIPLGMGSFPLTISNGYLSSKCSGTDCFLGNPSFPSLCFDEFLSTNALIDEPSGIVLSQTATRYPSLTISDPFDSFPMVSTTSNQKESLPSRMPSISFASITEPQCGPLPQGCIRNHAQLIGTTNDSMMEKMEEEFPLTPCDSLSMFDPPFIPDSLDMPSETNGLSDTDSFFSDSSTDNLHKKTTSHKKTKKWSCSNCRYLNSISN